MNNARSPAPNVGFLNNAAANVANVAVNVANAATNVANGAANAVNNVAENIANAVNVFNPVANNVKLNNVGILGNNVVGSDDGIFGFSWFQIILMVVLIAIFVLIAVFYNQIITWLEDVFKPEPPTPSTPPMTAPPMSPEETKEEADMQLKSSVEKILPGRKEVFNVSQNKYTYYDAQALCKSLGSELATYDQVKTAYQQGADWCNYGWVEGQMAVFPTQEGSWEKLQEGPEDMRTSCGRPGVNGGYFDNPELQFGVTCFGVKPVQSKHDADSIAAGASAPLSPDALKLEKKVAAYRGKNVPIMPWSQAKWSQ
jgi:hypothetical protein